MTQDNDNSTNEPLAFDGASSEEDSLETIAVSLLDKASLYAAYMPFVQQGGLFIRSDKRVDIGDGVILSLKLMDLSETFTIHGNVVWITPVGAQGGLKAGMGIQFSSETPNEIRDKIETYLAGASQSDRRTDTL